MTDFKVGEIAIYWPPPSIEGGDATHRGEEVEIIGFETGEFTPSSGAPYRTRCALLKDTGVFTPKLGSRLGCPVEWLIKYDPPTEKTTWNNCIWQPGHAGKASTSRSKMSWGKQCAT